MEKDFDNTDRGSLHSNLKKAKEKDPDLTGSLNVAGKDYWISGWKYVSKAGSPYLSLSVRPKDEQPRQSSQPTRKAKTNDPLDW